jgi:hypothetical protein
MIEGLAGIKYGFTGFGPKSRKPNCLGVSRRILSEHGGLLIICSSTVPGLPVHALNLLPGEDEIVNISPRKGLIKKQVLSSSLPESESVSRENISNWHFMGRVILARILNRNSTNTMLLEGEPEPRKIYAVYSLGEAA